MKKTPPLSCVEQGTLLAFLFKNS